MLTTINDFCDVYPILDACAGGISFSFFSDSISVSQNMLEFALLSLIFETLVFLNNLTKTRYKLKNTDRYE